MRPLLGLALRLLDGVTQALNVIGSGLILLLMILVGVELVTLSIVAIVFLQIPQALRASRLTRSDALLSWLERRSPLTGKWLETLFDLVSIAVVWVIVSTTWPIFVRAWERGEFIGALGDFTAPTWPVKLTILIGGSMLILQFAARILRRWALLPEAEAQG